MPRAATAELPRKSSAPFEITFLRGRIPRVLVSLRRLTHWRDTWVGPAATWAREPFGTGKARILPPMRLSRRPTLGMTEGMQMTLLCQEIATVLPSLRRYDRAVTGDRLTCDRYILSAL